MDNLTVLVTGCGAPGIKGTLYSLENNFDGRRIRTIGTDIMDEVVGKYLCNKFYKIHRPSSSEYMTELLSICKKESVDVLLPQNTAELSLLASNKDDFEDVGTAVAVSDEPAIGIANDKYELMKVARETGVPVPEFYLVDSFEDLIKRAEGLGWPDRPVVIKPPVSNGMRGLRIIDESIDLKDAFFNEKPSGVYLKMNNLREILGPAFSSLLIMEDLAHDEYTVDLLSAKNLTIIPRKRDLIKSGITFNGTVEKNEYILDYSEKLSRKVGLKYAYGFQFKMGDDGVPKLLESNPRVQGTMVLATFAGANIIYGAVKCALGEELPEFDINWGTRILRYWGGLGVSGNAVLGEL